VEDVYRPIYFECLDFVVTCIWDRFNQPGYAVLKQLEDTLLKAVKGENYREQLESVLEFYKDDFIPSNLTTQLELLPEALKSHCNSQHITITEIKKYLQSLSPAHRSNFSEVVTMLKIILVTHQQQMQCLREVHLL
jgi:hypothetical protein